MLRKMSEHGSGNKGMTRARHDSHPPHCHILENNPPHQPGKDTDTNSLLLSPQELSLLSCTPKLTAAQKIKSLF